MPLIRQQAGFIVYDARPIGTTRVCTSSTFETRAGAEFSLLLALRWSTEKWEMEPSFPRHVVVIML